MLQLAPRTIVRAARALFASAHSDILIFLAFKAHGARLEEGVSEPITVSSTSAVTSPLRYLCWINESFETFVKDSINKNQFDANQLPLPSRPMGNSAEGYSLYFPISDNARYLIRKSDSNRGVVWTRGVDKWRTDKRYGIQPHESLIEVSREQDQGAVVKLRPDYVYAASTYFGPEAGKRCSIPLQAFVIWCCRNEIFNDIASFGEMERRVTERLYLSDEEIHILFTPGPDSLALVEADFVQQRDDDEYNRLLCFGEPEIPTGIVVGKERTVEQLKFESQVLGLTETMRINPVDLATRMWQGGQLNLLFVGAPRTSKSHWALGVAEDYLGITRTDEQWSRKVLQIQFHQEWRYGDFIQKQIPRFEEGALSFDPQAGVFLNHCRSNREGKSVVIIEEINRANVAAVFGEGFYLIETSYRSRELPLPYGGGTISIPKGLLLIATMNTIDRSTYPLDYALLSRFRTIPFDVDFQEMMQFLTEGGKFDHDEALTVVADMRQISEVTKYPIGQAHFVSIRSRVELYDWYITVLRPSLQIFLTKYQEHIISGQVDSLMEKYRM